MDSRTLLQQAVAHHRQGALGPAETLYLQILAAEPANVGALQLLGTLRTQQGRHDEAIRLIGAALERAPTDLGALLNQSTALRGAGRLDEALAHCDRAIAARPDFVEAWFNRGALLAELKRPAEALESFERTLKLQPGHGRAQHARGLALSDMDRGGEALAAFDGLLAGDPGNACLLAARGVALARLRRFPEALRNYDQALGALSGDAGLFYNRGVALVELARLKEALESYDRAVALDPGFAEAWYNRGIALAMMGEKPAARQSLEKALALAPRHAEALTQQGLLLWEAGRFGEALASYDRALEVAPSDAAWNGRGAALRMLRRIEEARTSFDRAIALSPTNAQALSNRADLLWRDQHLLQPAISDLEQAIAADPDHPYALGELLHLRMYGADWRNLAAQIARIEAGLRDGRKVARPFVYQAVAEQPAQLQRCCAIFAGDLYPAVPSPPHAARNPGRLRIGYVSGEFGEQATAHLMAGLYERHDRARFEIIAVDNGASDNSPMRARLEAAFDRFLSIAPLSDDEAAEAIRAAQIDILVNLNGYFGAYRSGVFARRPAPVQVNYLGFPGTMGAPYMDYIIADRTVIPEDELGFFTEKVVTLPDSFQANDSRRAIAAATDTRADHDLPAAAFVFCSFNQSYKLLPEMFAAWMRILKATPGSVLWLLDSQPPFQDNLRRAAERHGVPDDRLIFAGFLPLAQHLARLRHADLFLDTLPCNAHTTASDALWAGLPLITCRGATFPGRVAASLLNAVGLPEMIAERLPDYEARAIALATGKTELQRIRTRLAENRLSCPLFDTDLLRRRIEDAYLGMWKIWQAGGAPESFTVAP